MQIRIKEMAREDVAPAADVAAACFGDDKRAAALVDLQASFAEYPYRPKTFVAKDGAAIVGIVQSVSGYIGFNLRGFAWLCVLPQYRSKGIGRQLLEHAERDAIDNHFNGDGGTFMLHAAYKPEYYKAMGYNGESKTHEATPVLFKLHHAKV